MTKKYLSTFTPEDKPEISKQCPSCRKLLPASRFKGIQGKRNNVKGTIRNYKCRSCEETRKNENKLQRISKSELALDDLTHRIVILQEENYKLTEKNKDYDARHNAIENILNVISDKLGLDFNENGELIKHQVSRFSNRKDILSQI